MNSRIVSSLRLFLLLGAACRLYANTDPLRLSTSAPGRHVIRADGFELRVQPSGKYDVYVARRRLIIGPDVNFDYQGRRERGIRAEWTCRVESNAAGLRLVYEGRSGDLAVRQVFDVRSDGFDYVWDAEVVNPSPATQGVFISGAFRDCEGLEFTAKQRFGRSVSGRFSLETPAVDNLKELCFQMDDRRVAVQWPRGLEVSITQPKYQGEAQKIFHIHCGNFYPEGVWPRSNLLPGDRVGFAMRVRVEINKE